MGDEAKAAMSVVLDDNPFLHGADLDKIIDEIVKDWDCPTCIKGEITPEFHLWDNDIFWSNPWEGKGKHGHPTKSALADNKSTICIYGSFVMDANHDFHPEIHPAELVWFSNADSIWLMQLQDASERFDREWYGVSSAIASAVLALGGLDLWQVQWSKTDIADWSRPWSAVPRWNEFRVAFKADPTGASTGQYGITSLYNRHVKTTHNDSAKFDADNGTVNIQVPASGGQHTGCLCTRFASANRSFPGEISVLASRRKNTTIPERIPRWIRSKF